MIERNKRISLCLPLFGAMVLTLLLFSADIRFSLPAQAKENIKRSSHDPEPSRHLNVVLPAISCLACARRIERKLRQTAGIISVTVSFLPEVKMDIFYNAKLVSEETVFKLVASEGYRVEKLK